MTTATFDIKVVVVFKVKSRHSGLKITCFRH